MFTHILCVNGLKRTISNGYIPLDSQELHVIQNDASKYVQINFIHSSVTSIGPT